MGTRQNQAERSLYRAGSRPPHRRILAPPPGMARIVKPIPLPLSEARSIWLRAQRLDTPAPFGSGPAATRAAVEHLGYVQIDTIHVIERSHHHILYTRIPDYRREDLHQRADGRQDRLRVLDARARLRADARLPLLLAPRCGATGSQPHPLVRPGAQRPTSGKCSRGSETKARSPSATSTTTCSSRRSTPGRAESRRSGHCSSPSTEATSRSASAPACSRPTS